MECPPLEEFERCDLEPRCQVYTVRTSEWGPCIPHQNLTCGNGVRRRFSECVRSDGNVVSREFCQHLIAQADMSRDEPCINQCPVDCVVSEWSNWSPCSATCGIGYQMRSRTVIVQPNHRGRHCPDPLVQRKYCPYQECFRWELGDWEVCEIEKDLCGFGIQHRNATCIRLDGIIADSQLCDPRLFVMLTMMEECYVPCPGDCHISQWSSWGPCHRPCKQDNNVVGIQTRSRVILNPPAEPSRQKCPSDFIQTRSCSTGQCPQYKWQTGSWIGNKRQVWCQDTFGAKVIGACQESEKPSAVKSCHPPCVVSESECRDFDLCVCKPGYEPFYQGGFLRSCQETTADSVQIRSHDSSNNLALYGPYEITTDIWMYSIMASCVVFAILLVIAIYAICWRSRLQRTVQQPRTVSIAADCKCRKADLLKGTSCEKRPSNEYYEQTDVTSDYNFLNHAGVSDHGNPNYWESSQRANSSQIDFHRLS